jgi:hypothetical protein
MALRRVVPLEQMALNLRHLCFSGFVSGLRVKLLVLLRRNGTEVNYEFLKHRSFR